MVLTKHGKRDAQEAEACGDVCGESCGEDSRQSHGSLPRQIFPDHKEQLTRLARIEGQIKGVRKMIEERRYCIDIVTQVKAVTAALRQVEMGVLERHIHHCVSQAARTSDPDLLNEKIEEVVRVVSRM